MVRTLSLGWRGPGHSRGRQGRRETDGCGCLGLRLLSKDSIASRHDQQQDDDDPPADPQDRARRRCKNVFFILVMFLRFLTFFIFQTFFILKNVGKVQSSKQINKKHFRNNSDETDMIFLLHVE